MVGDCLTLTICPASTASAKDCTATITYTAIRTSYSATATAASTSIFSSGPACPLRTNFKYTGGLLWSLDGFSYATYRPPSMPTPTPSTTAVESSTATEPSSAAASTTLEAKEEPAPTTTEAPASRTTTEEEAPTTAEAPSAPYATSGGSEGGRRISATCGSRCEGRGWRGLVQRGRAAVLAEGFHDGADCEGYFGE